VPSDLSHHEVNEEDDQLEDEEDGKVKIRGQYCLMKIILPLPPKPKVLTFHKHMMNLTGNELEG